MPSYRHHELGDLYVHINVKFPDHMDPTSIPMLEQALPPRKALEKLKKGSAQHYEETTLEEPNDRQRRSAFGNTNGGEDGMDEDDEDGRPGVQCAQRKSFPPPPSRKQVLMMVAE